MGEDVDGRQSEKTWIAAQKMESEWHSRKRDILVARVLRDVCERHDHLNIWLCPDIKKALYVHWETDEGFRHRCLTKRANIASARSSKYTGG
ncbi:hypothetical protein Ahy_B07g086416 isoform B [Arachis hypogaea]|uniref:Uncharacterized protein n=1 Tax=Arachis hypogaea TaxID=3818 RepID=A0A444Y9L2_ARAHY|nr:hypothetical protein Ahy_B07g086416 isoform B [Arachis hypogaea]